MPWRSTGVITPTRRGRRAVFGVGLLIGLLAMPVAVWASHQFGDVPDSSPYHKNITALAESGVAGGYADGTYKPTELVSRQHMAAFLHRGLGRLTLGRIDDVAAGASDVLIGSLAFRAEGAVGGYQGVLVTVTSQLDHDASVSANCNITLTLKRGGTTLGTWYWEFYPTTAGEESSASATFATTQATQTIATYELRASSDCSQPTYTDNDLVTIQNFPFEGDGTGFTPASIKAQQAPREGH